MLKTKTRFVGYGLGIVAAVVAITLGVNSVSTSSRINYSLQNANNSTNYVLNLDSSNKVTSNGDFVKYTARGGAVTFTYSGVNNSTSGHVTLNANGTLVNKDQITSIASFTPVFSGGTLKARVAYVTDKFGDYFELTSGSKVNIGSNPYFLELKAFDSAVTLTSARYEFTCTANPDAEAKDTSGSYDITFNKATSDSSQELSSTGLWNQITTGDDYISSVDSTTKLYAGSEGIKFGSSKAAGNLSLLMDSTKTKEKISSIVLDTAQYGNDTGLFRVYVNGSSNYESTTISPSVGGKIELSNEVALSSLEIETSTKRAYLSGISLLYGSKTEPGEPLNPTAFEVGFSADDANKNNYTTNSIFANEKSLSVVSNYSDGHTSSISESDYSYVIKDSNNETIDPTTKFPAIGEYTLIVSYGNYIPQEITLHVGEYIYPVDVEVTMTTTTFNTADTLSNNLSGNLKATLEFSNGTTSEEIAYSDFGQYGIDTRLLTPRGITYDDELPFGTAGTWTLKVFCISDEIMYKNISLTVNAIPVESITLNETSYELHPTDTLQLVPTVGPSNATNQLVSWMSNNEDVATVSDSGLVTAIAVGEATITCTAKDGSNVFGTCTITVKEAPVAVLVNDTLTQTVIGVTGTSYTSWSNKNGASGAVYAGQSAGPTSGTGSGSIQLRTKNSDSGIVSTTSGGKIKKVIVDWNSSTSDRILKVYAKNTAYSAADDLYTSNSGTEVGSISSDNPTQTELTITGDYEYVGVRSSDSALYMDSITFVWSSTSGGGSGGSSNVYPTSIDVSAASNSIAIGSTTQLSVDYTPSNTNVKNVTYSSSNESVATVSSTGLVTGVSQGSVTITATAEAESGTVNDTVSITVTPIAVSSVSLSSNSESIKVGKTVSLVAEISPANATNKNVTWTSSDSSVATVSNGVVTGVAAGTVTITVSTVDGNKTATCTVVVIAASGGGEESYSITYSDLPTSYQTGSTIYTASSGFKFQAYNCANYSSKMQFKASSGYLQSTEELELQSVTINDRGTNTLTVYGSNTAGSFSTEINGVNDVYDLSGYHYFKISRNINGAAYCSSITVVTGTPTPTDPTGIILSPTSVELSAGGTKQLSVSYVPSNANQNKEITWTSSNTNVATVSSDGLITVKSTASAGQGVTITARLTNISTISATCTVSVVEKAKDDHTVLIYICGADLESQNGLATGDIYEILKVSNQPDDVNIVIETGGASSWSNTYNYGISSTKLERWHVENKKLVRDDSLSYASMGLSSTLQSFIEYGLTNYPADRTGLVLWNHGGGMRGVCYDEKKNDDVLKNSEVRSAVSGALSKCGMSGQKLEWIGYDACLMAVQDIAVTNSDYFNYMVASEESEAGYGWDYDNWVDDLYAHKTTPTILKAIVDSFISDNGGSSSSGDQTLSYLNLAYAKDYKDAWEAMASQLTSKVTTSNRSSFNSAITGNIKHYADSDYDYFCTFDAWDFVDKLANNSAFSSFRIDSSYTDAVKDAHSHLVAYNLAQKGAGVSKGLAMYWPNSSQYSDVSTYYTTSETTLTTWRTLCVNRGYHA